MSWKSLPSWAPEPLRRHVVLLVEWLQLANALKRWRSEATARSSFFAIAAAGCGCVLLATHSLDIVEHYADKAALLIDGRIVREWTDAEIATLREQGANAFEAALASAADQEPKPGTREPTGALLTQL